VNALENHPIFLSALTSGLIPSIPIILKWIDTNRRLDRIEASLNACIHAADVRLYRSDDRNRCFSTGESSFQTSSLEFKARLREGFESYNSR
jgi:hypothetical protein